MQDFINPVLDSKTRNFPIQDDGTRYPEIWGATSCLVTEQLWEQKKSFSFLSLPDPRNKDKTLVSEGNQLKQLPPHLYSCINAQVT